MSAAPGIDCLFVGILKDYGRAELDLSHEYVNLFTGLVEHPALKTRAFHPDVEALKHGADGMRERFAEAVQRHPPELLVHQPFTPELDIGLDLLADLTRKGVATVEWDADSHWRFDEFIAPRIGSYTLFVTTHDDSVPRYAERGADVHLSQWAVSSWYAGRAPDTARPIPVSFVGQIHGQRKRVVRALRRGGVPVHCWGRGWTARRGWAARLFHRGRNHGYGPYREILDAIGASRVSLNLSNASIEAAGTQIKGRHFEIPALGACQVTTPTQGIERYYEPGTEIVVAEDGRPLRDVLRELLADPARARRIAEAGHARTWAEHTWRHRIDAILAHLGLA